MSFEELWLKMVEKKPLLVDQKATVTISTESFKEQLRQAYEKGFEKGRSEPSIFDQIFGCFRKK